MGLSRRKNKRSKTTQFLRDIVAQWPEQPNQGLLALPNTRETGMFPAATVRQLASGVGFSAGGSMPKLLAVMQVMEKLPIAATSATRASRPMVFSAAA